MHLYLSFGLGTTLRTSQLQEQHSNTRACVPVQVCHLFAVPCDHSSLHFMQHMYKRNTHNVLFC